MYGLISQQFNQQNALQLGIFASNRHHTPTMRSSLYVSKIEYVKNIFTKRKPEILNRDKYI